MPRTLNVFNNISLDGYFTDANGDMSWAQRNDPEWQQFTENNASGGSGNGDMLAFGRVTYDMMASFWTSDTAREMSPVVAGSMNAMPKLLFSRTVKTPSWGNTKIVNGDIADAVAKIKSDPGPDITMMGSGAVIAQLADAGLIDTFQLVIVPIALGGGRTLFEGLSKRIALQRVDERAFTNGNVVVTYRPA